MNPNVIESSVGPLVVEEIEVNKTRISTPDGTAIGIINCAWWNLDVIHRSINNSKEKILAKIKNKKVQIDL